MLTEKEELLIKMAKEIYFETNTFEEIAFLFGSLDELIKFYGFDRFKVAKLMYNHKIKNLNDPYFRLNNHGNIESFDEKALKKELEFAETNITSYFIEEFGAENKNYKNYLRLKNEK